MKGSEKKFMSCTVFCTKAHLGGLHGRLFSVTFHFVMQMRCDNTSEYMNKARDKKPLPSLGNQRQEKNS
jgi:hypothetical protein